MPPIVNYCQVEKENTVQDSDLKRRMFLFLLKKKKKKKFLFFGKAKYVLSDDDSTPCFLIRIQAFLFE